MLIRKLLKYLNLVLEAFLEVFGLTPLLHLGEDELFQSRRTVIDFDQSLSLEDDSRPILLDVRDELEVRSLQLGTFTKHDLLSDHIGDHSSAQVLFIWWISREKCKDP